MNELTTLHEQAARSLERIRVRDLWRRSIVQRIAHFSPRPGDLIVLSVSPEMWNRPGDLEILRQDLVDLNQQLGDQVVIAILPEGYDLRRLPEEEMNQMGWYRGQPREEMLR